MSPLFKNKKLGKTALDYVMEANDVVDELSTAEALLKHGQENVVFIDVRDSEPIKESGTIEGALRIPRGFIEFAADDSDDEFHNEALTKDKELLVFCSAGPMAAMAGKTLKEMGYEKVYNIGGFFDWMEAGGPVES